MVMAVIDRWWPLYTVLWSVRDCKRDAAGRVEQVTAIHRFKIMEFRTGLFFGDRYRQVAVI